MAQQITELNNRDQLFVSNSQALVMEMNSQAMEDCISKMEAKMQAEQQKY